MTSEPTNGVGPTNTAVTPTAAAPEHEPVYRRVVRRETHASRSVAATIVALIMLVLSVAAIIVASVVLLRQRFGTLDPRAVVDAIGRAPHGVAPGLLVGAGVLAVLVGIGLVLHGLLPGRLARHALTARRIAAIVDDEVIASALAEAARHSSRLGPEAVVAFVRRRRASVVLQPAAGLDAPVVAATEAVEAANERIATLPPLEVQVRVQLTGRVDG